MFQNKYVPSIVQINTFPNATVAEHGTYNLLSWNRVHKIKAEIYARGPGEVTIHFKYTISACLLLSLSPPSAVAAGINANPLLNYQGGVIKDGGLVDMIIDHIVSIVGWDVDDAGDEYWIVRNR